MPDLITHVALGHLVIRPLDWKTPRTDSSIMRHVFFLGCILPDIVTRPWYIVFPSTHGWTFFLHTPIGAFLLCAFLAQFFEKSISKNVFTHLLAGSGFHFFIDAFQKQVVGNSAWLFPISYRHIGFGIAWTDQIMDLLPLWLALVVVLEIAIRLSRRPAHRSSNPIQP
jgi:hypothetical protein